MEKRDLLLDLLVGVAGGIVFAVGTLLILILYYEDSVRGGEKVKEVAKVIPENEFQEFLGQLSEEVAIMRKDGMGYVSITCQLAKKLTVSADTDSELTFTAGQIKRILDLAK